MTVAEQEPCGGHEDGSTCLWCSMPGNPAEHGQEAALKAVSVDWDTRARQALVELARTKVPFTSEDLIAKVGLPKDKIGINQNNAVGSLFTKAHKAGIIRKHGHTASKRRSSHGATIIEWIGV